jgi:hypothetical protein
MTTAVRISSTTCPTKMFEIIFSRRQTPTRVRISLRQLSSHWLTANRASEVGAPRCGPKQFAAQSRPIRAIFSRV